MIDRNLQNAIEKIKLLVSDVDGVLTDGRILISTDGVESKFFNVEDGTAAALARYAKIPIALISGRYSKSTEIRSKELQIKHCFQNTLNKKSVLDELAQTYNVEYDQIAYIGDSLVDIPLLEIVGFPISVSDAHNKAKKIASYTTSRLGGEGVLLEVIELILQYQGRYDSVFKKMRESEFEKKSK
tara:strand:- start:430 stop:984 length:555 start_codon:yes stop_codon:yes gene_type:complete